MIRNLRKDFNKNVALSDAEDNPWDPLNGGGTSDSLFFENSISKFIENSISIDKFDSFK